MSDVPVVPLAGSEGWANAYENGEKLAERFPGQDADQFVYACEYNDEGPTAKHTIVGFEMLRQGERDEGEWQWQVDFSDGSTWIAEGGCDYTGWDCRSWLGWEHVSGPKTLAV